MKHALTAAIVLGCCVFAVAQSTSQAPSDIHLSSSPKSQPKGPNKAAKAAAQSAKQPKIPDAAELRKMAARCCIVARRLLPRAKTF